MYQVKRVQGGSDTFSKLVHGGMSTGARRYIEQKIQNIRQMGGDAVAKFTDTAYSIYNSFNGDAIVNATNAFIANSGVYVNDYFIQYEPDYTNLPNVNLGMQKYIMVNPELFEMNQQQTIQGYDNYYNPNPSITNVEDHPDYQRVMDGIVQTSIDGDFVEFFGLDDEELLFAEQDSILRTWRTVGRAIAKGIDPTTGSML